MNIIIKVLTSDSSIEDALYIRKKVFIEEKSVSEEIERDKYDKEATHVVAYYGDIPISTGRLLNKDGGFSIGRLATLKEYRKIGAGRLVTKELIKEAKNAGAKEIKIHAMKDVQSFYEKLGFKAFGDVFLEAGIEHIKMELEL